MRLALRVRDWADFRFKIIFENEIWTREELRPITTDFALQCFANCAIGVRNLIYQHEPHLVAPSQVDFSVRVRFLG